MALANALHFGWRENAEMAADRLVLEAFSFFIQIVEVAPFATAHRQPNLKVNDGLAQPVAEAVFVPIGLHLVAAFPTGAVDCSGVVCMSGFHHQLRVE